MSNAEQDPIFKQIRNLLSVLVLGIACAAVFAGALLYYYGPSGVYKLGNVIVSPAILATDQTSTQPAANGPVSRFSFDKVEFSYLDTEKRQWITIPVNMEKYRLLYNRLAEEASLGTVEDAAIKKFHQEAPSKLVLSVRIQEDDSKPAQKIFQEVQFAKEGDFYRVELHEQSAGGNWAYFYHPGIYREALEIFVNERTGK